MYLRIEKFVRDKVWLLTFIVLIASVIITFYVEVPIINDGIDLVNIISVNLGA